MRLRNRPWRTIELDAPASYEASCQSGILGCLSTPSRLVRALADKNFALLMTDPRHPSLHFKKVGQFWSARVDLRYRALPSRWRVEGGMLWFWIGSHADYDAMMK